MLASSRVNPVACFFLERCRGFFLRVRGRIPRLGFLLEFVETAAGISGIGVEFEGLLVVADGGIGHVLMLALTTHDGVFGSEAFQEFTLGTQKGQSPLCGLRPTIQSPMPRRRRGFFFPAA